jgi:hypothetical protein
LREGVVSHRAVVADFDLEAVVVEGRQVDGRDVVPPLLLGRVLTTTTRTRPSHSRLSKRKVVRTRGNRAWLSMIRPGWLPP